MSTTRVWWVAVGIWGQGCLADPLEGSRASAEEGTRVELMLVPIDEGASIEEGAAAFDEGLPTTESLDDLARGDGAYVIGVADGWGIALVPANLTDEAGAAQDAGDVRGGDGDRRPDDSDDEPASCATDCGAWCSSTLHLCDGDGASLCDCSAGDPVDPIDPDDEQEEEAACTWSCDEWCTTALDHCDGDGYDLCDCSGDDGDAYEEPEDLEEPACARDCDEWCSGSLELCEGDGWELCGDTCEWTASRTLPPSASAGGWIVPIVVGGVALLVVYTDPEVQAALDRGESIGQAVGGTYGRRAEEIMRRLRELRREIGELTGDARRSCVDLLTRQGYRETLEVSAGERIRVGICMQDQLTVWPHTLTIRAGGQSAADLTFANLGSGLRTVLSRDATVGWTHEGRSESVTVPEGGSTRVSLPLGVGARTYTVAVPRDDSSTRVSVTVTR